MIGFGGGQRKAAGLATGLSDPSEAGVHTLQYILVCEVQADKATRRQNRIAFGIGFRQRVVNAAINVDNQTGGVAVKVYDEAGDHLLPPKVKALQL